MKPSTRDAVLDAAQAVFARHPAAGLDEVVREAGVGRATVFRLFTNREGLLRATALRAIDELDRSLDAEARRDAPPAERLVRLVEVLVDHGDRLRFVLLAGGLVEDPEVDDASQRVLGRCAPVFAEAARAGHLRSDVDLAWQMAAVEALVYAAWDQVARGHLPRAHAARLVLETAFFGLAPR